LSHAAPIRNRPPPNNGDQVRSKKESQLGWEHTRPLKGFPKQADEKIKKIRERSYIDVNQAPRRDHKIRKTQKKRQERDNKLTRTNRSKL